MRAIPRTLPLSPPRRIAILLAALALACLALPLARAADIDVTVDVSPRTATVGSEIEYSVVLQSKSRAPNTRDLTLRDMPRFEGLRVRSGPITSTSTRIINGRMSASLTLTWSLLAEKAGDAHISQGEMEYDGKKYILPAQKLRIVQTRQEALPQAVRDGSVLPPQTRHESLNKQLEGRLFARLELSDDHPWIKQTVTASLWVYVDRSISGQLANVDYLPPTWNGFFVEEVPLGSLRLVRRRLGDRSYMAVEVKRYLLTPTQSGTLSIPLSEGQCTVRVQGSRRRSFEDSFFSFDPFDAANRVPVRLPVAGRDVEVRALPTEGRPPSFQGAVGDFAVTGGVDRRKMTQDDILTLRIEVGGEGYLGSIAKPALPEMPAWRLIDEQVNMQTPRHGREGPETSSMGKKVFEYLLRPEKVGKVRVPGIAYSLFSPREKRYIEQTVGPFEIDVAKGKQQSLIVTGGGADAAPTALPRKKKTDVYPERLAYIHVAPTATAWPQPLYARPWFVLLQIAPLAVLILAGAARIWRGYRSEHADSLRYRAAGARARRELREARTALKRGDHEAFWIALGEALRGYAATKLGRQATGLTLDEVRDALRARGADDESAGALRNLIEHCDQARFMGRPAEAMAESLDEASAILRALDKVL